MDCRGVLPNVRKIAVLRANGIGDFILALPALEALRLAYPQAEVVLLGREWHRDFLAGRPGPVDRVAVVPPWPGVTQEQGGTEDPAKLAQFFEAMAREGFDLALQLHGGGRYSNPLVRRLGARVTAGLRTPDAPPLDRWVPYIYFQHETLRYLEVASLVGAWAAPALEPRLAVTQRDLAQSLRVVPQTHRPLVARHPGAGDPRRRWPAEKFARVGDALAQAGARVVVIGTEAERQVTQAVARAMAHRALDLCGRLSLCGLAGLLWRCSLLVSNDSGPLHLARAVGTATVGIYWGPNLINAGPLTRESHRTAQSWRFHCPECGLNCMEARCVHSASFVADVPVEEVVGQALELLASQRGSHPWEEGEPSPWRF